MAHLVNSWPWTIQRDRGWSSGMALSSSVQRGDSVFSLSLCIKRGLNTGNINLGEAQAIVRTHEGPCLKGCCLEYCPDLSTGVNERTSQWIVYCSDSLHHLPLLCQRGIGAAKKKNLASTLSNKMNHASCSNDKKSAIIPELLPTEVLTSLATCFLLTFVNLQPKSQISATPK